jgi:hypothetical protein
MAPPSLRPRRLRAGGAHAAQRRAAQEPSGTLRCGQGSATPPRPQSVVGFPVIARLFFSSQRILARCAFLCTRRLLAPPSLIFACCAARLQQLPLVCTAAVPGHVEPPAARAAVVRSAARPRGSTHSGGRHHLPPCKVLLPFCRPALEGANWCPTWGTSIRCEGGIRRLGRARARRLVASGRRWRARRGCCVTSSILEPTKQNSCIQCA